MMTPYGKYFDESQLKPDELEILKAAFSLRDSDIKHIQIWELGLLSELLYLVRGEILERGLIEHTSIIDNEIINLRSLVKDIHKRTSGVRYDYES